MKRYLFKLVIGLLIVFASDFIIGNCLQHFYFKTNSGILHCTTFAMESTQADILIFGSSRASHHYDVKLMEDSMGLSVYNTGRDGNYFFYQTAVLKSVLKRYTPKQIILDFTGTFKFNQEDYDKASSLLPYYRTHKELRSIIELRSPFEKYKFLSKIYPFNSLISTIVMGNLKLNQNRVLNTGTYNGFVPLKGVWHHAIDTSDQSAKFEIDNNKYKVFSEFIELTIQYKIPLIVVYSPSFYSYYTSYSLGICKDICKKYNISFFDYSKDRDFLIDSKIFEDPLHLNQDGAKLFTNKLLKTIKMGMN